MSVLSVTGFYTKDEPQFHYFKIIQPKAIDLSTRLYGITIFVPRSTALNWILIKEIENMYRVSIEF